MLNFEPVGNLTFGRDWLEGRLVRLIYLDEAGTSPKETVRVVAGVIVHGDHHLKLLSEELEKVVNEQVPDEYKKDFWFHAKDVFNGGRIDRQRWAFEDRLYLCQSVLNILFVHDIPIVVGTHHADPQFHNDEIIEKGLGHKIDHLLAFGLCLERANYFLAHNLAGEESGTIVAEDAPDMKRYIRQAFLSHKNGIIKHVPEGQRRSLRQKILGLPAQEIDYHVKHIVDVPHFVEKPFAPMLQFADACAFAFRRGIARQKHGDDLIYAMLGPSGGAELLRDEEWFKIGSGGLFNASCRRH